MKLGMIICILLITMPTFAGTFRENFDKNLDNWYFEFHGDGTIEIKANELVITDLSPELATLAFLKNGNDIEDFKLNVDAMFVKAFSDKTWDYMCIMSRCAENVFDKGVAWLSFEEWGNIPMLILTPPPALQQFGRRDIPFPLELGRWYHIQIEMNKGKLALTVDGKLIHTADWSDQLIFNTHGTIGLGAGGAEIHFDNFVITGDNVPDNAKSVDYKNKLTSRWGEMKLLKVDL